MTSTQGLKIVEDTKRYSISSDVKRSLIWASTLVLVVFTICFYYNNMTSTLANKDIRISEITKGK